MFANITSRHAFYRLRPSPYGSVKNGTSKIFGLRTNSNGANTEATKNENKDDGKEQLTKENDEHYYEDPVELAKKHDEQIEQLRKSISDVKYSWRLTLADIDNLTKKAHKETAQAREAGAEKMIKKLFPILDNIDYCLKYKPDFSSAEFENNIDARGAYDGLESAKKQLCNALASYDTQEVMPMIGDNFDPLLHEAVTTLDGAEYGIAPGTIGQIFHSGWIKQGILLRAAAVGVAKVLPFDFKKEDGEDELLDSSSESESEEDEKDSKKNDKKNKKY
jgi:molecular chaperone GrpE